MYSTVCVSLIIPSRLITQLNISEYLCPSPCPSLSLLSTVSFFLFLFLLVLLPSLSLTTYNLLPVVLSSSEPDRASYLAKRTLSTIYRGCPTEFQPSMALDFFPKLLTHLSLRYCMVCVRVCVHYVCVCMCVYLYVCVCVSLLSGSFFSLPLSSLHPQLHSFITEPWYAAALRILRAYCYVHRLFLHFLQTNPELVQSAKEKVKQFIDNPDMRSKEVGGERGEGKGRSVGWSG